MPIRRPTIQNNFDQNKDSSLVPLILAIRVTPRKISSGHFNKKGTKEKKLTLSAFDILEKHIELLDAGKNSVFFSTGCNIDFTKIPQIKRVLFFNVSEGIYVICKANIYRKTDGTQYIPDNALPELQVDIWRNQPEKTWIQIFSYEQIFDTSVFRKYPLLTTHTQNGYKNLEDLLLNGKRFNFAYAKYLHNKI